MNRNSSVVVRYVALPVVAAIGFVGLIWPGSPAKAVPAYELPCEPVEAVWARGSGQPVSTGLGTPSEISTEEYKRFEDQLTYRFPGTVNIYELGRESIGGYQYPAVPVGADSLEDAITSGDAALTGGDGGAYGASMIEGANELDMYVYNRILACPESQFVLGGYSQGANVAGKAYVEGFIDSMREAVTFQMLFGDPKLYLPEGEGGLWWGGAPACRGEEFSPWRRVVPDCNTDNGSLGARKPYLPEDWEQTTGLWCAEDDFVCGSSKYPWIVAGHFTYAEPGGAIDAGVLEAAQKVKAKSGPDFADQIVTVPVLRLGTTGLDVVFLIDSTGSMADEIDRAKDVAGALSTMIEAFNGRVALAEYRDQGDVFTARVLSDLEAGIDQFRLKLDGIAVDGGGDTPEALLHALMVTMNGVSWREGATKAVVVLSDDGYHDPDLVDGTTRADVAGLSLAIDPVNVYPVVPSWMASSYHGLAEATSGQVVEWGGDVAGALTEALARIEDRPVALLPLNAYYAEPGQSVRFDGSRSYSPTSEIVQWDWDFEGDGVYEVLDGDPVAVHVYDEPFTGFVQLRVTDANGLVANVSASVSIGQPRVLRQVAPEGLTAVAEGSAVRLTWDASVDPGQAWRVTVNGVQAGLVETAARSVVVTDIPAGVPTEFGVGPVATDGEVGPAAYVSFIFEEPSGSGSQPGGQAGADASSGGTGSTGLQPGGGVTPAGGGSTATPDGLSGTGAQMHWKIALTGLLVVAGLGLTLYVRSRRSAGNVRAD
ncbi:MAG: cutinase family protein [Bifidobacteriaceae bacterium]|nr:cutinase family protein [Bifidobacteriaceae bacterium]